jgi:hypothetical protein
MAVDREGFLADTIPGVQASYGLGEQSALLTKRDVAPSVPYRVTGLQETIPAAPPVSVRGGLDPFAGGDLSTIISPFTDPKQIEERRKRQKLTRERIKAYGGAEPLFEHAPSLQIQEAEVPEFGTSIEGPFIKDIAAASPEVTKEQQLFGLETRVEKDYGRDYVEPKVSFQEVLGKAVTEKGKEYAQETLQEGIMKGLKESWRGLAADVYGNASFAGLAPTATGLTPSGAGIVAGGGQVQGASAAYYSQINPSTGMTFAQEAGLAQTGYGARMGYGWQASATKTVDKSMRAYGKASSSATTNAMGYAMAAYSAYNAYNAFKAGDTLGGITNTVTTLAAFNPALIPVAIALNAVNFISKITGWGRGKPKQGFGGSELKINEEGTFSHSQAYAYNGFDPSGAKKHTDMVAKYLNAYQKELGVTLNYKKAQEAISGGRIRGGNYLTRVDVSPWKDGSGSASEMLERWLSAGVFDGTPTYYDAYAGERLSFQSQTQYEKHMSDFSNRIFS